MKKKSGDELLSLSEAAKMVGVHRRVLKRMAQEKKIAWTRVGSSFRFQREDVEEFALQDGVRK